MRYLGAHLLSPGGIYKAVETANAFDINCAQIMVSAPMRWSPKELSEEAAVKFVETQKGGKLKKIMDHGVYLINLARADSQMFHLSKLSVLTHLNLMYRIEQLAKENGNDLEVLGTTFHPGSAKDLSEEEGLKRISEGLNWIIKESKGGMILLESSAGAGSVLGDQLEELAAMRSGVEDKKRVGYVLDTQHMFVSGYDWVNDLEGIVAQIDKVLGLENIKAFHLNDSKPALGSHKDRHENLGDGAIGLDAITKIVNHSKLKNIPFIMETPNVKGGESLEKEMALLKRIAKD